MNWYFRLALIFFLTLSTIGLLAAEPKLPEQPTTIYVDAEQYTQLADKTVELVGKVKVIRGLEVLTCDRALVNMSKQEVTGQGNVTFMSPTDFVKAEKFQYNFETKTGIIYNGFMQRGQETIEGEEIRKNGDSSYTGIYSSYTTCTTCPAGWRVSGSTINATKGSYAFIKNPIIRIYGIPILWLPYMVIPIKNERQSGFLAPSFGWFESHGFTLSESFFWAINRSSDMTLTATHYKKRELKTGLEYRYVADANSSGTFQGFFINDRKFGQEAYFTNPDSRYDGQPRQPVSSFSRYGMTYNHRFELPNNFTNTANLRFVRDTQYINDFPEDVPGRGDPALDNRITLSKNTDNTHASIDTSMYQDLLKADPIGDNRYAIHRVPSINYSVLLPQLPGTKLLTKIDFTYLNLARPYKTFDGKTEFNPNVKEHHSTFDEGDHYRTGQRFRFTPTAYYPIIVSDYLNLVPEVSYEETYYQFGYGTKPRAQRRLVRTSINARSQLSAVLGSDEPNANRYKHQIEPDVTYTTVPFVEQDEHPFFGTSQQKFLPRFSSQQPVTEFDTLQFDATDRLLDRHVVTFGISNKIIRKRKIEDQDAFGYKQIFRHRLSQSFDISNYYDSTPNIVKQPWSEIKSLLEVRLDQFGFISEINYFPYQNITSNSASVTVSDKWGNYLGLGYSQGFSFQTDPITGLPLRESAITNRSDTGSIAAGLRSKYLDFDAGYSHNFTNRTPINVRFSSLLKPPGKCWGLLLNYSRELAGPGVSFTFEIPFYFGEGRSFQLNTKRPMASM